MKKEGILMRNKRIPALLMIVALAISLMAACGSEPAPPAQDPPPPAETTGDDPAPANEPDPPAADEDITLEFIHIWPEHQATMEESVKYIEDTYGFNINLHVVPWNEITQTIQVALTGGDMYDVFFMWGGQSGGYVASDALLNLQPYFDADPSWESSFLSPTVLVDNAYVVNGDIYGIPFRGTGSFMIYNKGLFNEMGYTVPKTQEDLEVLMEQMVADDVVPIATPGTPHADKVEYVRRCIADYLFLDAGIISSPGHLDATLLEYNGLRGESAEITRNWFNKGFFGDPKSVLGVEREEAQTLFFMGRSGMLWCNNNELPDLRALEAEFGVEIDAFQWPAPANASVTIGYAGMNDGFGAWSGTAYPDAAADLLKGLTSMPVQAMWGDRAFSIMPLGGINYADPLQARWADEVANMTRFVISAQYNMGTQDNDVADYFGDFLITPSMTGADYEDMFKQIREASIANAD